MTLLSLRSIKKRNLPIIFEVQITSFSISQKLMLYHFLILQLLLVCIKDSGGGEKKLIKMIIKKAEIDVCAITEFSNVFDVHNVKLLYNMTD